MNPALVLALIISAVPPAEGRLDRIADLLGERKCDDAFLLLSEVKVPSSASKADVAAARKIAKRAAGCRAADPVGALAFNSLAVRLAPADLEVRTAHAEGLIAALQFGEAAALLDALVAENPADKAPQVWLLRGKLAAREGDHEVAVRVLTPLAADPELKGEVAPLLIESKGALAEREQLERGREATEGQAEARARRPEPPRQIDLPGVEPARHAPGTLIGSYPGLIGRHGRTGFTVRGLAPGRAYAFLATGSCKRKEKELEFDDVVAALDGSTRRWKMTNAAVSGLDFRVQFGNQPSRAVAVAQNEGLDRSRVSFIADAPEMLVSVFDESSTREEVDCVVSGFAVEAD